MTAKTAIRNKSNNLIKHENNISIKVQISSSRCFGLISQNLKYLAGAENRFICQKAAELDGDECLQAVVKHGGGLGIRFDKLCLNVPETYYRPGLCLQTQNI